MPRANAVSGWGTKAGALQDAIFNSANFSSIATDERGVIQLFNVGAERMLGYAAADVLNTITPADISDPQEVIARAEALSAELGTRDIEEDQRWFLRAGGTDHEIARHDGHRYVTGAFQTRRDDRPLVGFILGDENLLAARRGDRLRRRRWRTGLRQVRRVGRLHGVHDGPGPRRIEGPILGGRDEVLQLGRAGADRGEPDRAGETAQSMDGLRQRGGRPVRAVLRDLVDEDPNRIAPGGERADETPPRLVQHLLQGIRGSRGHRDRKPR
jgi:PAS domain S-box-containing protein